MKKTKININGILGITAVFLAFVCVVSTLSFIFAGEKYVPAMLDIPENEGKKSGYYTFLIAGTDAVSNSTDVLMLASLDVDGEAVSVLQIPRDTYIDREVAGYKTVSRINAVYAAEYNKAIGEGISKTDAKKRAMEALRALLEEAFCIDIDEYVLVDISAFRDVVDAVGGVDFDVPYDMNYSDPYQNLYIDLKAGYQHLDGAGAEQLIRFRSTPTADMGRIKVRGDFLKAMISQVKEKLTFKAVYSIIKDVLPKVTTSAGLLDTLKYARCVYGAKTENINIKTMTAGAVALPGGGWSAAVYLNKLAAKRDIEKYINKSKGEIDIEEFDKKRLFCDDSSDSAVLYYEREDL